MSHFIVMAKDKKTKETYYMMYSRLDEDNGLQYNWSIDMKDARVFANRQAAALSRNHVLSTSDYTSFLAPEIVEVNLELMQKPNPRKAA